MAKYEYVAGMSPGAMSNDVFPFRYTDILMMKAECLLRTGKADEAAQIVTEIRQRAFKSAPEKAVVTGAELMGGVPMIMDCAKQPIWTRLKVLEQLMKVEQI